MTEMISQLNLTLQENKDLRLLLFYIHASSEHILYGDDGEMSCGACGCDFKRDTPQVLRRKMLTYSERKANGKL